MYGCGGKREQIVNKWMLFPARMSLRFGEKRRLMMVQEHAHIVSAIQGCKVMQTLPRGEAANLVIKSVGKYKLHLSHTVQVNKDAVRVQIEHWTLDFEGVTLEQLQILAAKTVKIWLQRKWSKDPKRMDAKVWDNCTFRVPDVIKEMGTRATADPETAADKAFDKLTPDQQAAFIAKHVTGANK